MPLPPIAPLDDDLERHLVATREATIEQLLELVRMPSVSALPQHAADMVRTAEWLAGQLRWRGAEDVEVVKTALHPIVTGRIHKTPGAPTVIVYCHYDVQPVDPLDLWESAPFEPFVRDGRMVGRGTSDDKGQIVMHLAAIEALQACRGELPVNLTFVFEGEEEFGSQSLYTWIDSARDRLAADVAVISDTGFFEGNRPMLTIGLRGIMYAQIDVVGSAVDLHSGGFGGVVENPANALATIIAALKGPDGRVRIPGFYDEVRPLTDAEREAMAALPFDEEAYRKELGVPALVGEQGFSVLERRGARPTLDIHGLWGGFQGEGSKTIIPAHVHAKISCRLVPDQDPATTFARLRDHVQEIAPPGVTVTVVEHHGGMPSVTPIDHPATQAAARALKGTFGVDPLFSREGGSIPVASAFDHTLGLPVVLLGFSQPNSGAHAPNEWLELANLDGGIRTIIRFWDELAASSR